MATSGGLARTDSMDPTIASLMFNIQFHLFDALVGVNPETLQLDNSGLAESWKLLNDTTWQFKLKKAVKFHNGDELTADDVKYTVETMLDPKTPNTHRGFFTSIQGVEKVDNYTVNVITKTPDASMPGPMATIMPVPHRAHQQMGRDAFGDKPIGTGPFKIVRYAKDEFYEMEANPSYWGKSPKIKKFTYKYVAEPGTKIAGLRSGEVDIIDLVPPSEVENLKKDPSLAVQTAGSMRAMFIGMNSFKKPFDDRRVRQAMNYAVNWDEIMKNVVGGGKRLSTMIAKGTEGFDPSLQPYPYNPDKAKSLLVEAGYPNGFETTFDTPVGWFTQDKEVAQAVAAQLEKIGVRTQMLAVARATFWDKFLNKRVEGFYLLGCGNVQLTFEYCTRLHFHSKWRGIYYNTPRMDAILDKVALTMNPEERKKVAQETQRLIQEEAPFIFGYEDEQIFAHKKALRWKGRVDERMSVREASWE
ncbi:MAG: hypothetical protein HY331_17625 [Chloroflexi bacterium]|nr:hypothetical protein [Chloroflexota bacterium]